MRPDQLPGGFDPVAWDCAPNLKTFALEFESGGSFKWIGKASTLREAEDKARAQLAAEFHTFSPKAARLVAMEAPE
jgi:hypothetical protein